MKKTIIPLFLLLTLVLACGPTAEQQTANETEPKTEEPTTDNAATEAPSSEETSYTVIKDGIPSPRMQMKGQIGGTTVTVVYGSPSVKGREIWGALVPYGKVWRTGANEATTIELSGNAKIGGEELAAGKYALFTKNEADKSTIIFNKTHEQWGAYDYNDGEDAMRIVVVPTDLEENVEKMTFVIEGNALVLQWAKRAIAIPFSAG